MMRHIFLLAITAIIIYAPATAQDQLLWQSLDGPRSSDVRSFAQAPNGDMYVLVIGYGDVETDDLYRSTDDGASWTAVTSWEGALAYTVAVAPDNALYVGTHFDIKRSTDGGATWEEKDGQFGFTYTFLFGDNGRIVAPGNFNGKYTNNAYSTDNGATWQVLTPPRTDGPYITGIAVGSGDTIFAATYRDRIFKTGDYGATWTAISDSTINTAWYIFANEPALFALADWSMIYSTDGGGNWSFPGEDIGIVNTCATDGANAFIAGRDRDSVYISKDYGRSWEPLFVSPVPGNYISSLAFGSGGDAYVCTAMGLYRVDTLTGTHENLFQLEGGPLNPADLFVTQENTLFATAPPYGGYRTGVQVPGWKYLPVRSPLHEPLLSFEQSESGAIFAFAEYSLHESDDDGVSWQQSTRVDSIVFTKHTALGSDGTLYVVTNYPAVLPGYPGGIHYATENNPVWEKIPFHTDTVLTLALGPLDRLFAATPSAVYSTINLGASWEMHLEGEFRLIYSSGGGSIYISGRGGMYGSDDGGASWQELPFPYPSHVVAMAKDAKGHLFAALSGFAPSINTGGVYLSRDGGVTWTEENTGLPSGLESYKCSDMVLDREGHLVIAIQDGVYRTSVPTGVPDFPGAEGPAISGLWPNPVAAGSPVTVRFTTERRGAATLHVYSLLGKRVLSVALGDITPGLQSYSLATQSLPPGAYRYAIHSPGGTTTGKLMVR